MKRLGILISGRGSNFEAIANSIDRGQLDAEIAVVVSNRQDARGLDIARARGIATAVIPSRGLPRAEHDRLIVEALEAAHADLICLAGYMRLLSVEFIRAYPLRILNIHPSLLPSFPGLEAQAQALQHGVKVSGCTVHFVDEHLDAGPIILQAAVPVLDEDTPESLAARILAEEHRIYSQAIALVLSGTWRLDGRRVLHGPSANSALT